MKTRIKITRYQNQPKRKPTQTRKPEEQNKINKNNKHSQKKKHKKHKNEKEKGEKEKREGKTVKVKSLYRCYADAPIAQSSDFANTI